MGQLFVVERYDDTGTPGSLVPLPAVPADVHVVCIVRVPADDVVLALIEGVDESTLRAALTTAGWRVDRITPATWAHAGEAVTPRPAGPAARTHLSARDAANPQGVRQ